MSLRLDLGRLVFVVILGWSRFSLRTREIVGGRVWVIGAGVALVGVEWHRSRAARWRAGVGMDRIARAFEAREERT